MDTDKSLEEMHLINSQQKEAISLMYGILVLGASGELGVPRMTAQMTIEQVDALIEKPK